MKRSPKNNDPELKTTLNNTDGGIEYFKESSTSTLEYRVLVLDYLYSLEIVVGGI